MNFCPVGSLRTKVSISPGIHYSGRGWSFDEAQVVTGQKGKSPILANQALDLAFQLLPGSVLYIHAFAGTETPEAAIPPPTRTGKRI